jgi:uncharacterized protein (TIGR02145 family)
MAENLNYNAEGSKCYNCAEYGRLYDWTTAKTACPSGLHLPSDAECTTLVDFVGSDVATKLKAKSGWDNNGNGTDNYGFSALPGGYQSVGGQGGGIDHNVGIDGYWWSATEEDASYAYGRHMSYKLSSVMRPKVYNSSLYSVRCVNDYSVAVSSSSSGGSGKGNDINNYRTVAIGGQTWMAENLDYAVEGSKCYDEDPAKCAEYGRLYNWATAMALPSSCNENTCSSQIQSKHRGICPSEWHIPSEAEWDMLVTFAGGSGTAGTKLKAASGWSSNGNGTDDYEFSALPGGSGYSPDGGGYSSNYFGYLGYWWSATENDAIAKNARSRNMSYEGGVVSRSGSIKSSDLFSVRCVKDSSAEPSSSSVAVSSSSSEPSSSSVPPSSSSVHSSSSSALSSSSSIQCSDKGNGTFTDAQNGKTYRYVTICSQTWMAENLNYDVEGSKCYDNKPENCVKYGSLYSWWTAMDFPSCYISTSSTCRGVCPSGWHLPSKAEWDLLGKGIKKLQATSGWGVEGLGGGTDDYGFSALPGGYGGSNGSFGDLLYGGYWWSANEEGDGSDYAYYLHMDQASSIVSWDYANKTMLYSVRCVED